MLEQVNNQEMRDEESVHTVRNSCYHKEKGAEKTFGGEGVKGMITHQLQKFSPLGLVS